MRRLLWATILILALFGIVTMLAGMVMLRARANVQLVSAAHNGDVATVSRLLERGAKPDTTDFERKTALIQASSAGHIEVVNLLLQSGAQVNRTDRSGWTALMWAAKEGKLAVVAALLAAQADPNLHAMDGTTALTAAKEAPNADQILPLLTKAGAKR